MKTVKRTSIFPASKETVFKSLLKLETLQYIAYPHATFTPLDGADSMSWEVGSTSSFKFRLRIFSPSEIEDWLIDDNDCDRYGTDLPVL